MAHSPTLMTCELSSITNTPGIFGVYIYIYIYTAEAEFLLASTRQNIILFTLESRCACENDDVVPPKVS